VLGSIGVEALGQLRVHRDVEINWVAVLVLGLPVD
jgi:hypothetical protein